jgi:DNA helicase-2/ATP-dependent DNA helicase PcrA
MTRAQSLLYLSCPRFSANGSGERNKLSPFVEPVKDSFMKKGPCLDRPVMSEIARILHRTLPPEESIYKGIPAMFSLEDNLFPVDPEEARQETKHGFGRGDGRLGEDASRAKRPRLQGPSTGPDNGEEVAWKKYTTTMEQASTFTVAALPGFMNVAAHQAAITAANVAAQATQKAEKKPATNKRPPDQKSIMGFVRTKSGAARLPGSPPQPKENNPAPARSAFGIQSHAVPAQPAIAPDLAGHKLGAGKLKTRPTLPSEAGTVKRNQYACFSSSPPRPAAEEDTKDEGTDMAGLEDDNEPPPEPTRPAACLHLTTSALPKGLGGGLRRPLGLGRENITPIQRLRKPFKPLTMSRP